MDGLVYCLYKYYMRNMRYRTTVYRHWGRTDMIGIKRTK